MSVLSIIASLSSGSGTSGGTPELSYAKNVQLLPKGSGMGAQDYRAFGFKCRIVVGGELKKIRHIFRAGTAHAGGGKAYWQDQNISTTNTWGWETLLLDSTLNIEDCAGGLISDDKILVCFTIAADENHTAECFYIIYDLDMNPLTGHIPLPLVYDYGWAFSKLQATGDGTDGHFVISFLEYNTVTAPTTNARVCVLVSTDNWATYTKKIVATGVANESIVIPVSATNWVFMTRVYGPWRVWRTSNSGDTWEDMGTTTLGFLNYKIKVYQAHIRGGNVHLLLNDRDSGMLALSRNNSLANVWANIWNPEEIQMDLFYGTDSLFNGLGYGDLEWIKENKYLVTVSKEMHGVSGGDANTAVADIYWYILDMDLNSGSNPAAPTVTVSLATGETRIDVTNYTNAMIEDYFKYFRVSLFTSADYNPSSIVTAQWSLPNRSDYIRAMDRVPIPARFLYFFNLGAGTYYGKLSAENLYGESAETPFSFTI